MNTKLSDEKLKFTYKEFGVNIYDIKFNNEKWFCTVNITSPINAPHVDDTRINLPVNCKDDKQAIEIAQKYAISWIEKTYF